MRWLFAIHLVFSLSKILTGQTWEEYYSQVSALESISDYTPSILLTINDKRWDTKYVDKNDFGSYLFTQLSNRYSIASEKIDCYSYRLIVDIEYFNYYETESGNLYLKGIVHATFFDINGDQYLIRCSDDIKIDRVKYKQLGISSNRIKVKENNLILSNELTKKLLREIQSVITLETQGLKKAVTFGKSKILNHEIEKARKSAIFSALVLASEKTWGIKIESITKMIDFGQVTQNDFGHVSGHVVQHNIVAETEYLSTDGYICLLVESIIKKP